MKFATKPIQHYPPHLRHVPALPWEIQNFCKFLSPRNAYAVDCAKGHIRQHTTVIEVATISVQEF